MNKDVFNCFKSISFTNEEISYLEDNNDNIFLLNIKHLNYILNYLIENGLNYGEIKNVLLTNIYFATITTNNLEALDRTFIKKLNLNKEDLINLISSNIDFNEIDFNLISETNTDDICRNLKKYKKNYDINENN